MSDLISAENTGHAPTMGDALQIPVKWGLEDEQIVVVKIGSKISEILEIFAAKWGTAVEELVLFREDDEAPMSNIVIIDLNYLHHRRHHVHLAKDVKLTVFYQGQEHQRDFKRRATVEDVLIWAIKVFNVDPTMATEFELARQGQTEQLPGNEHIGHLAGKQHEIYLDLVRGDIANGGCL